MTDCLLQLKERGWNFMLRLLIFCLTALAVRQGGWGDFSLIFFELSTLNLPKKNSFFLKIRTFQTKFEF
jgi:hypothetical protein